ncbi:peptidoglycan endopeptidase [Qipengyuania sp. GH1]|uniref:peptidoglycan endopeptidase n=1 Tax=Qipengyuania aestuarii TaxID=2867241 RepID=UPI001C86A5EE|nr:peptidoglycan endopeptidase [Qipengyuania aestuarii]MBX7536428.1 peptidoglycan endopeptidase [Qipengyuania aestuarii]
MTPLPERFAAAAERLVGTPFRLHGRDPAHGLDCVGVVLCALRRCGVDGGGFTPRYGLRNSSIAALLPMAAALGLREVEGGRQRGDVLLVRAGPAQQHLLVITEGVSTGGDRFVHAHAGLRRVVLQHGADAWPPIRHWRLTLR